MVNINDRLYLFDFDRTLFDTATFSSDIWEFIATEYGIDKDAEVSRAKQFYRHLGQWYDYDFFRHVAAIPAIHDTTEIFCKKARHALSSTYLYEDARTVLALCDEIVTFGNRQYQEFKLGFCSPVAEIPTQIIQTEKGEYIAKQYADKKVVLVDDKNLAPHLPAHATFILLNRQQLDPVLIYDGYIAINSLEHFEEAAKLTIDS